MTKVTDPPRPAARPPRRAAGKRRATREIRVGVSGWHYPHWRRGAFFPRGLPQRRELEYVTRHFNAAEINASFYSLLEPETYERYRETAPRGFRFAVKGSRFITHAKKLKDVETALANFLASGLLRLEEKLGPILWQLPEMQWDVQRVADFLEALPKETGEAARLARRHDHRVAGRASYAVSRRRRLRHALELRHEAFFHPVVVRACRRNGVALVVSDSGRWPLVEETTAGFVYLRLHGSPRTYASNYDRRALERWAGRIACWTSGREPPDARRITALPPPRRAGRDAWVFFDNDHAGRAPRNALALMRRLGVEAPGRWEDA